MYCTFVDVAIKSNTLRRFQNTVFEWMCYEFEVSFHTGWESIQRHGVITELWGNCIVPAEVKSIHRAILFKSLTSDALNCEVQPLTGWIEWVVGATSHLWTVRGKLAKKNCAQTWSDSTKTCNSFACCLLFMYTKTPKDNKSFNLLVDDLKSELVHLKYNSLNLQFYKCSFDRCQVSQESIKRVEGESASVRIRIQRRRLFEVWEGPKKMLRIILVLSILGLPKVRIRFKPV